MDGLFRGMMGTKANEIDALVTPEVRDFLMTTNTQETVQLDLVSLNLQRGRDQGISRYNDMRMAYGLPAAWRWGQITSDRALQARLEEAYVSVNKLDAWIGGIAEDHVGGGSLGLLFRTVWEREFVRLRDGDRFYFENTFHQISKITTLDELVGSEKLIGNVMRHFIVRNADIPERDVPKSVGFV